MATGVFASEAKRQAVQIANHQRHFFPPGSAPDGSEATWGRGEKLENLERSRTAATGPRRGRALGAGRLRGVHDRPWKALWSGRDCSEVPKTQIRWASSRRGVSESGLWRRTGSSDPAVRSGVYSVFPRGWELLHHRLRGPGVEDPADKHGLVVVGNDHRAILFWWALPGTLSKPQRSRWPGGPLDTI